jgi:hypothetical protein
LTRLAARAGASEPLERSESRKSVALWPGVWQPAARATVTLLRDAAHLPNEADPPAVRISLVHARSPH